MRENSDNSPVEGDVERAGEQGPRPLPEVLEVRSCAMRVDRGPVLPHLDERELRGILEVGGEVVGGVSFLVPGRLDRIQGKKEGFQCILSR